MPFSLNFQSLAPKRHILEHLILICISEYNTWTCQRTPISAQMDLALWENVAHLSSLVLIILSPNLISDVSGLLCLQVWCHQLSCFLWLPNISLPWTSELLYVQETKVRPPLRWDGRPLGGVRMMIQSWVTAGSRLTQGIEFLVLSTFNILSPDSLWPHSSIFFIFIQVPFNEIFDESYLKWKQGFMSFSWFADSLYLTLKTAWNTLVIRCSGDFFFHLWWAKIPCCLPLMVTELSLILSLTKGKIF